MNISNNYLLQTIPIFSSLETINGPFYIYSNATLNYISGFSLLTSIEGSFDIKYNTSLTSISGFNSLIGTNTNSLIIEFNKTNTTICDSTYTRLNNYYSNHNYTITIISC